MKKLSILLLAILTMSLPLVGAEGETCEEAFIANEGTNIASGAPSWFSFTVPVSGKKWIISSIGQTTSDTYLIVYDTCEGNIINENDDYIEGLQSEVKLYGLEQGETIIIYWSDEYSSSAFNWSISSSDSIIPGEDCSVSADAEIGLNNVPYIENTELFWYSFTLTDPNSKIVITSTRDDVVFIVTGSCAGYDFDVLGYGDGNLTLTNAELGEVFIVWFREDQSEFEWNLAVEELLPGEGCSSAFEAKEGINEHDVAELYQPYWYSFTVPSADSKIVINHDFGDVEFEAYRENCSVNNDLDYSKISGEITIKDLYVGETIYLKWAVGDLGPFEWNLEIQEVEEGETCGKAIQIDIGSAYTLSTIPGVNKYWYEFTAPQETGKMIIIQTFQDASFELYSGSCENLMWKTSGYGTASYYVYQPGEQLYLSWWPHFNGDLSWEMYAPVIQPGDICTVPKVAEVGSFTEEPNITGDHWYSFTMPDPDSKLVISSTDEIYPSVYKNDCSKLDWVNNSYSNGQHYFYDIAVGEEVLIHLYGSDYTWNLSVESLEPGESCSSAELVQEGINEVPETTLATYWYTFIAPVDAEKSIIINSDVEAHISVVAGDCEEPNYIHENYKALGFRNNYPGETLHIRWDLYQGSGFEWELIFQDPQPGEDCESAILVEEGNQTINGPNGTGKYWYRFVMPDENAKVTISTNSGVEATVLKGNCVTNSVIDYGESVAIDDLAMGDELLIIWNAIDFVWNIKVDALPIISVTPEEIQSTAPKFGLVSEEITINNDGLGPLYYNISASYGLAFDGRSGHVEFPHSSELNPEDGITILLWLYLSEDINCNSGNNWRFILSKGFHWQDGSYEAILEEDRSLTWRVNTVGGQSWYGSTKLVPIGSWTHLAFSYDASSSTHKIFINGAEDETGHTIESGSGDILGNNQPFVIGSQISYASCADGAGVIPGNIDEVMVWDEALNEQAIRELMLMPPSNSDQGLVAFWNFDNVVNNEVTDQSNNENVGYLIGAKQSFGAPVNLWINIPVPFGTVNAENSLGVDIGFSAVKLEQGTYQSQIIIFSNDPTQEFVEVPVTFIVDGVLAAESLELFSFSLNQNYPNPMLFKTKISYYLVKGGYVDLSVYNMLGQKVATLVDEPQHQGPYDIDWSGVDDTKKPLINGLYVYRLQVKHADHSIVSASARLIISR